MVRELKFSLKLSRTECLLESISILLSFAPGIHHPPAKIIIDISFMERVSGEMNALPQEWCGVTLPKDAVCDCYNVRVQLFVYMIEWFLDAAVINSPPCFWAQSFLDLWR